MSKAVRSALLALFLAGSSSVAVAQPAGAADRTAANDAEYIARLTELSGLTGGPHTLTLTADIDLPADADPAYTGTEDLTIDGAGNTISGGDASRILQVTGASPGTVTFKNITVTNGESLEKGGAIISSGDIIIENATVTESAVGSLGAPAEGAAIHARDVTLTDATITNNDAIMPPATASPAHGGAIRATRNVVVTDSTVSNNRAEAEPEATGGAIAADGTTMVTGSTLADNVAQGDGFGSNPSRGGGIRSEGAVTISQSTVDGNTAARNVGGAEGGAIWSNAGITVTDSSVSGNTASGQSSATGGALRTQNGGEAGVDSSTIARNSAIAPVANGGAISTGGGGATSITDSIVSGNKATGTTGANGGATFINAATTTITRSTVVDNEATSTTGQSRGGALYSNAGGASTSVTDSTLLGNRAQATSGGTFGGAVYEGGVRATITNSTVHGNEALSGGGVYGLNDVDLVHATVVANEATGAFAANIVAATDLDATASVVANPVGGTGDCSVGVTSSGDHNVESGTTCGFEETNDVQDATPDEVALGQPRNNGGADRGRVGATPSPAPTPTMYPLAGSILIDAIAPADCAAAPELDLDQRGVDRPFGDGCDIGAIEAVFPAHGFTDATPFFEPTIRWVTSEVNTPQILLGFPDNTFGQELNITRGQAARLYHRGAGSPDPTTFGPHGFSDVTPFYEDAIRWAKGVGLFNGYPDNTFRQGDPITRGQYIRSLHNFAGAPTDDNGDAFDPSGLTDVTPFYEPAVTWAKHHGLANGFPDNTFRQNNDIKRGNAARTFYNTAQTKVAWEDTMTAPPNMLFKDNLAS